MIKAEVVFNDDNMIVNNWIVYLIDDEWEVVKKEKSEKFVWLEDAIKYCLEN